MQSNHNVGNSQVHLPIPPGIPALGQEEDKKLPGSVGQYGLEGKSFLTLKAAINRQYSGQARKDHKNWALT